jgi:aromatic ring hydroxylase
LLRDVALSLKDYWMSDYRMFIGSTAVARAMRAGADFAKVSAKTGEMVVAANAVIGERVAMMVEAARDPQTANYAEFARCSPRR